MRVPIILSTKVPYLCLLAFRFTGVLWEYNRHHSQWEPVVDPERYKQHPNMMVHALDNCLSVNDMLCTLIRLPACILSQRIHQDFSTSAVDSSTDHHMSQDVVVPSQVPCRHLWPYHDSHGRRTNRPCRSYVLSVLWSKSIFCIRCYIFYLLMFCMGPCCHPA